MPATGGTPPRRSSAVSKALDGRVSTPDLLALAQRTRPRPEGASESPFRPRPDIGVSNAALSKSAVIEDHSEHVAAMRDAIFATSKDEVVVRKRTEESEEDDAPPSPRTPSTSPQLSPRMRPRTAQSQVDPVKHTINDLTQELLRELNFDRMIKLKRSFQSAVRGGAGGVSVGRFVRLMFEAIPHKKGEENALILRLSELFAEIDVDSDEEMTWDEFTSFMVKSGVAPIGEATNDVVMKRYQEVKGANTIRIGQPLAQVNYISEIDKLIICDVNKHNIAKVYSMPIPGIPSDDATERQDYEIVLARELRGHRGSVLASTLVHGPRSMLVNSFSLQTGAKDFSRGSGGGPVEANQGGSGSSFAAAAAEKNSRKQKVDDDYSETLKYLATTSVDGTVAFWDSSSNFRLRCWWETATPQTAVAWAGAPHFCVVTGDIDGVVRSWNLGRQRQAPPLPHVHTNMVTSIVTGVDSSDDVASASLDGLVILWDISKGVVKRKLAGHRKGVWSLAYSVEQRFLFSAGSDREALVWNPMVRSKPIFRLKGHNVGLVGVRVVPGSPQVITADMDGNFKLWDIRSFECVQTFGGTEGLTSGPQGQGLIDDGETDQDAQIRALGAEENSSASHASSVQRHGTVTSSFTVRPGSRQIITSMGSEIVVFEYDKPGIPWLTQEFPVEEVLYNPVNRSITTCGGDCVTIWDAATGLPLRRYDSLCKVAANQRIRAACLDSGKRKLIVGDTEGRIHVLNYSNGAVLRTLDPHAGVVNFLAYGVRDNTKLVISTSNDGSIWLHDELDENKKDHSVLQSVGGSSGGSRGAQTDVSATTYDENLGLIAVGTAKGTVWIWDGDKLGFEAKLTPQRPESSPPVVTKVRLATNRPMNRLPVRPHTTNEVTRHVEKTKTDEHAEWVRSADAERTAITALKMLYPFPLLVICDNLGNCSMYLTKPAPKKNHVVLRWRNATKLTQNYGHFLANPQKTNVQRLEWEPTLMLLIAGSEDGVITVWSLKEFVKAQKIHRVREVRSGKGNRGKTKLRYGPRGGGGYDQQDYLAPDEIQDGLKVVSQWNAHYDAITSLCVVGSSESRLGLLSGSADKRVRCWTIEGDYLGSLRQSPTQHFWSFPVDSDRDEESDRVTHIRKQMRKDAKAERERRRLDRHTGQDHLEEPIMVGSKTGLSMANSASVTQDADESTAHSVSHLLQHLQREEEAHLNRSGHPGFQPKIGKRKPPRHNDTNNFLVQSQTRMVGGDPHKNHRFDARQRGPMPKLLTKIEVAKGGKEAAIAKGDKLPLLPKGPAFLSGSSERPASARPASSDHGARLQASETRPYSASAARTRETFMLDQDKFSRRQRQAGDALAMAISDINLSDVHDD